VRLVWVAAHADRLNGSGPECLARCACIAIGACHSY